MVTYRLLRQLTYGQIPGSTLFIPSFRKESLLLGLTFNNVVKCRIFKCIKVVLSVSQNEAASYNKHKPLPLRVLTLLIYPVIGIEEL